MRKIGFSGRLWKVILGCVIIILILIGIIFMLTKEPVSEKETQELNPEDIVANYEEYIGENITVEAFFYDPDYGDEFAYASSQPIEEPLEQGEFIEEELLLINYSSVENITETSNKYYFKGIIKEINYTDYPLDLICLNVN